MAKGSRDSSSGSADSRADAAKTLKDLQERLAEFYEDFTIAVQEPLDRGFEYVENVLGDKSSPTDWIKDGVGLWIQGYSSGRGIWDAAHKFWFPPTQKE
jgi:hypothetical protein